jgi:uncharacterized small protein (DUF1192 family)
MKKYIGCILFVALGCMALCARTQTQTAGLPQQSQQSQSAMDSIAVSLRVKTLEGRKADLTQKIAEAEAQRNIQVAGASAATLEALNDRQDSLCLALRSQLVNVELELGELKPDAASASALQQLLNSTNATSNNK